MPRSRRDDDDDDDDDRPRRKTRRDRDDDDDEDDDDRPPRKRSRAVADDDDGEDEDDRPRKRKAVKGAKKKAGGAPLLLILGLAGGLFLLLAGGGVAAWLLFFNDTPERAFADFKDAVLKRDYGRMYDRMDRDGQQEMEKQAEFWVKFDQSMSAHSGKKGRELVVAVHKEMENKRSGPGPNMPDKMKEEIQSTTVEKVEVSGDTATLTLKTSNGRTETGKMVKQDGRWRVKKR
jgi:hypothetical protein